MCSSYNPSIISRLATNTHRYTQTIKPFCLGDPSPPEGYDGTSLPRQKPYAFQAELVILSRSDGCFWLRRPAEAKPLAKTGRGVKRSVAVCVRRAILSSVEGEPRRAGCKHGWLIQTDAGVNPNLRFIAACKPNKLEKNQRI